MRKMAKEYQVSENFPKFWSKKMWPSSSPDLNPTDFLVWSYLEKDVCSTPHISIDNLKKID